MCLVGAPVVVVDSPLPHLVGLSGYVLQETKSSLGVLGAKVGGQSGSASTRRHIAMIRKKNTQIAIRLSHEHENFVLMSFVGA